MTNFARMEAQYKSNELSLIHPAEYFGSHHPPFVIGSFVVLNSGGPTLIVVDDNDDAVTVAWKVDGKPQEWTLPAVCVHREPLIP